MASSSVRKLSRPLNQQQPTRSKLLLRPHQSSPIRYFLTSTSANMPSSKGKPTDPELREQLKEGKITVEGGLQVPLLTRCVQKSSKSQTNLAAARDSGPRGRYVSETAGNSTPTNNFCRHPSWQRSTRSRAATMRMRPARRMSRRKESLRRRVRARRRPRLRSRHSILHGRFVQVNTW